MKFGNIKQKFVNNKNFQFFFKILYHFVSFMTEIFHSAQILQIPTDAMKVL